MWRPNIPSNIICQSKLVLTESARLILFYLLAHYWVLTQYLVRDEYIQSTFLGKVNSYNKATTIPGFSYQRDKLKQTYPVPLYGPLQSSWAATDLFYTKKVNGSLLLCLPSTAIKPIVEKLHSCFGFHFPVNLLCKQCKHNAPRVYAYKHKKVTITINNSHASTISISLPET